MDKKRLTFIVLLLALSFKMFAQENYSYQPLTKSEQAQINNIVYGNNVNNFLVNNAIHIGPVDLTDITNIISYNPIEGTRIRLSAQTNNTFSKRLAFRGMVAFGTEDLEFKYGAGVAYNFAKNAKSVYSFPASTLSLNYSHNSFMPSASNYDVAYYSIGSWDRFYFGKQDEVSLNFLQQFPNGLSITPFANFNRIYSYLLYDHGMITELLLSGKDLKNYSTGLELSWSPRITQKSLFNIVNSRFYSFHSGVSLSYSYNYQEYIDSRSYNRVALSAQHRFYFNPMALDIKVSGGKIFGESFDYMYFSPNYRVSSISNMFGFNLYSPSEMRFKEYLQTFTQINFGGVLMDNIPWFKNFRPNEFLNLKALFTANYDPYFEAGVGIDHIFGFLGVEVIKRICKENPYQMPEWGFKIRCTL